MLPELVLTLLFVNMLLYSSQVEFVLWVLKILATNRCKHEAIVMHGTGSVGFCWCRGFQDDNPFANPLL